LFYYFHDIAPGRLETWILGQRLIQIALPLWIVSYAGALDDWVAGPLRRRVSDRAWTVLVSFACVALLAANGLAFARHQRHLDRLQQARDALVAHVPAGSLLVYQGSLVKIIGTPRDVPEYRFRLLEFEGKPVDDPVVLFGDLEHERRPWFLAILQRTPGEPAPGTMYSRVLVERFGMERVAVDSPLLSLYVARPDSAATPDGEEWQR
jgi:hypothetical protein